MPVEKVCFSTTFYPGEIFLDVSCFCFVGMMHLEDCFQADLWWACFVPLTLSHLSHPSEPFFHIVNEPFALLVCLSLWSKSNCYLHWLCSSLHYHVVHACHVNSERSSYWPCYIIVQISAFVFSLLVSGQLNVYVATGNCTLERRHGQRMMKSAPHGHLQNVTTQTFLLPTIQVADTPGHL